MKTREVFERFLGQGVSLTSITLKYVTEPNVRYEIRGYADGRIRYCAVYSDGDYYDGQQMDLDDFGCDVVNVEVKLRMKGISVVIIERSQ